ncbi:unnamed protein product [Aphanomyces euteiches]
MQATMSRFLAHVHYHPGADSIKLQFPFQGVDRQLVRQVDEELSRVLVRIERIANPPMKRRDVKAAAKQQQPKATAKAVLKASAVIQFKTAANEVLPPTQSVRDAFLSATHFEINEDTYRIVHNQPRVKTITVVDTLFVGVPIVPTVDLDFATIDTCSWAWHRGDILLSSDFIYTPTVADTGHALTLTCTPPLSEDIASVPSADPVVLETPLIRATPDRSVFAPRQALGSQRVPDEVGCRIMTYNILCDKYARADREVNRMYPFAAPGILQEAYRMPLVVLEVLENGADLIFFQEMGEAICKSYFEPLFSHLGFHGQYAGKGGSTPEGCAIFARSSKFDLVDGTLVKFASCLDEMIKTDEALAAFLDHHPQVAASTKAVPSIVQLVTLRAKHNDSMVLAVNSHMFYRHDANIVRLIQAVLLAKIVEKRKAEREAEFQLPVRLVLGGDLNARPVTSSIVYLLQGYVDASHKDWIEAPSFQWGDDETYGLKKAASELPEMPTQLSHSLKWESPIQFPFTTYLRNHEFAFQDTLDYILIDPTQWKVLQTFPGFTHEEVDHEKSLPSSTFPSDHISLVCDVAFVNSTDKPPLATVYNQV